MIMGSVLRVVTINAIARIKVVDAVIVSVTMKTRFGKITMSL
jgi:hypothetical protein